MAVELKRRRFTVEEYYQMARAGILGEDDRVELIEGEIVEMTPIGHRHALCVNLLTRAFNRLFADVAMISTQNPVHLSEYNEPQPDVVLARLSDELYAGHHPTPKEILLLVEVAASSAEPDRRIKVPLYSRHSVVEVWLVDLEQQTITAYTDPAANGYRSARVFRRGDELAPSGFPERSLTVSAALPE